MVNEWRVTILTWSIILQRDFVNVSLWVHGGVCRFWSESLENDCNIPLVNFDFVLSVNWSWRRKNSLREILQFSLWHSSPLRSNTFRRRETFWPTCLFMPYSLPFLFWILVYSRQQSILFCLRTVSSLLRCWAQMLSLHGNVTGSLNILLQYEHV